MISPDEIDWTAVVRPGDVVVVGQGTAEPLTLTRRLVAARERISPFTCFLGLTFSDTFAPERTAGINFRSYGALGRTSALAKAGRLEVLPWHYSVVDTAFASGELRADVVLLQLAPPPEGETVYSLSLANDYVLSAARHARVVVAEINPDVPWTFGAALPETIRLDLMVMADMPPQALAVGSFGDTERRIAAHVAALVSDGACLQFGIGAVPDATLSALSGHRDLGIHSGVIGDRVLDLIEAGVVTNARKDIDRGITVTNTILGTNRLFRYVHRNPNVEVRPATHTHDLGVLSRIRNLMTINSAVEVDLTGQGNAEVAGGRYVGGTGGQLDFVRGALASPGGRSIIALPATARGGTLSRIVAATSTVTLPRSDADLVVTEFGVADLRARTLNERAARLIAIAAPAFRDELARAWRDRGGGQTIHPGFP